MSQQDVLLYPSGEGILLVDKPVGVSSHAVVNWARLVSGIRCIGHAGTLDPLASGLLIILIGRRFTKMQPTFLSQDKEYVFEMQLGVESDTYDSTGTIVPVVDLATVRAVTQEAVQNTFTQCVGVVQQTVPLYSAVKQNGKKLYSLARSGKGKKVTLPTREVTLFHLQLISFESDHRGVFVRAEVRCSSGTYVRSLAHDIGADLGVGGMITSLQRTGIGDYSLQQATCCGPLFFQPFAYIKE